jgi:adenine deaminase
MHLESTKLWVDEFVRAVLPHGTTAVAADPHEIANVFGVPGVTALIEAAAPLPFTFGVCASSCVPASPFESAGAELTHVEVNELLDDHGAIGVAEVMNFPGVIAGDAEMLARIATAGTRKVDGHAPGLRGNGLDAYLAAGVESDHECTMLDEAREKRMKGMWVFIRQGSASKNLSELIPMAIEEGTDLLAFCTDDREPDTLAVRGHINDCIRLAVEAGLSVEDALVMATSNPANYHGFNHLGHLGPGYQADLCVFEDLQSWKPVAVYQRGVEVVAEGRLIDSSVADRPVPDWMRSSVHLADNLGSAAFAPDHSSGRARVIGVTQGSLTTSHLYMDLDDPETDIAIIGCVERHRETGRIGVGYVNGFGIRRGAIASTVAHDAHNCMVIGHRGPGGAEDMATAVNRLREIGGGQVVMLDGSVLAEVRLPIGGLISDRRAHEVAEQLDVLVQAATQLGISLEAPFMQLSFLGLSVIPQLRITDRGLLDVDRFELTSLTVS